MDGVSGVRTCNNCHVPVMLPFKQCLQGIKCRVGYSLFNITLVNIIVMLRWGGGV